MANRIGGRPYKKRLLPGVGYPIPISPAAAPSGGFASPLALWPFGFGNAAPNPFTLVQSGAVAVSGTLAASGGETLAIAPTDPAWTTSGTVVVGTDGRLTTPGDYRQTGGETRLAGGILRSRTQ